MKKSMGQMMYEALIDPKNGTKKATALSFKKLLDYLEDKKPISKALLQKFKDRNILDKNNKIVMEDPQSMLEWNLLTMMFEGIIERK